MNEAKANKRVKNAKGKSDKKRRDNRGRCEGNVLGQSNFLNSFVTFA